MDNLFLNVTSEGREGILHALSILWAGGVPGSKAVAYSTVKVSRETRYCGDPVNSHYSQDVEDPKGIPTLMLFWTDSDNTDSLKLPYPLNLKQAADFIADWLDNAEYGSEPDHDGDNGKGWRLFTGGHWSQIVAAQPVWAWYGK